MLESTDIRLRLNYSNLNSIHKDLIIISEATNNHGKKDLIFNILAIVNEVMLVYEYQSYLLQTGQYVDETNLKNYYELSP